MSLGIFFLAVAAIFAMLVVSEFVNKGPGMTPARKTWIIIAVIFALVGIYHLFTG